MVDIFIGEMLGTALLILIGNGSTANVAFKRTNGAKSNLIVVLFGWAIGVLAGVMVARFFSKEAGHINPAITLAYVAGGKIDAAHAFTYFGSQLLGALIGQILVDIYYFDHIKEESIKTVLSMHSTSATHPNSTLRNVYAEYLGTAVLTLVAVFALKVDFFGGAPLAIAFTVLGIGAAFGITGWAINPARDIMPRILHTIMYKVMIKRGIVKAPAKDETISEWKYSWIPVVAPLAGGATVGAFLNIG